MSGNPKSPSAYSTTMRGVHGTVRGPRLPVFKVYVKGRLLSGTNNTGVCGLGCNRHDRGRPMHVINARHYFVADRGRNCTISGGALNTR